MQNKNDNIIIFTPRHQIGAVLKLRNGLVKSEFRDESTEVEIKKLLTELESRNPSIKVGAGMSIGFQEIEVSDKKYPIAVLEEINRRGMTASFASDNLLKLLDWVTQNMPKDELEKELGNFLVMDEEEVKIFLDGLKEVYDILNKK